MHKKILKLAIPNIISNITIPLLGMVDLALMGHLDSLIYVDAIALGGIVFNFLYWSFAFLRMGTSGFTAQSFGRKDLKECTHILYRGLSIAILGGIFLLCMQVPIEYLAFNIIEGSNEVKQLAREYFYIRIWAAPATISIYAISGWFIGMQDSKTPMIIAISSNILNIILSYVFVYEFNMNAQGVALGTVFAQYLSLLLSFIFLYTKYKYIIKEKFELSKVFAKSALKRFFSVNKDIYFRTLCIIFVFTFFTSKSAADNDTILAVNTLLMQFLFLFSYFMDGFAYAAEALTGKYIGAKNPKALNNSSKKLFVWGAWLSIAFTLVYIIADYRILNILTDNKQIIEAAKEYIPWIIAIPIVSFASFLWDGIYIGATASKEMLISMLFATLLIFLPTFLLTKSNMGNHGLWLAMILFMLSRGVFQTFLYKRIKQRYE